MSMSTHVVGFIPPDAKWRAMRDARDACLAAGVPVPEEVEDFFGGEEPDPCGREVDLTGLQIAPGVSEWSDDYRQGYQVDLAELMAAHPNVKVVRFYNSW